MEFVGDALKTGRVTGALVQCPKLCQNISQIIENEKTNLRLFLGVIHFKQFAMAKNRRYFFLRYMVKQKYSGKYFGGKR